MVFDIDDTMCFTFPYYQREEVLLRLPHCTVKRIEYDYERTLKIKHYAFLPHFEIVLKYLLSQDCYVDFFSLGISERNIPLIETYLADNTVLGKSMYNQMKRAGQFRVFSRHNSFDGQTKNLMQLRRPGQTINDIILVDDSLRSPDVDRGEGAFIQYLRWNYSIDCTWALNFPYCLIGLFKSYFESSHNSGSLRQYVSQLKLKTLSGPNLDSGSINHSVALWNVPVNYRKFIKIGLNEVRKTKPDAIYFTAGDPEPHLNIDEELQ